MTVPQIDLPPRRERIFNVPTVILVLLAAMGAIHALREFVLSEDADLRALIYFAFIPARYEPSILPAGAVPGGQGAQAWTFLTYAFLHGDWMHLGVNAAWLLAFGSPLARRFGAMRFITFFAATAIAGALMHLATHARELVPMIGASAAISGAMAAAMRFVFVPGGPLRRRLGEPPNYHAPAISLRTAFTDPRILVFLGVWLGVNLLFGLGAGPLLGENQPVAWQAHVGGFFAGLLLFGLFDPPAAPSGDDQQMRRAAL
jgi:membrane associated rhomboid family serine protease